MSSKLLQAIGVIAILACVGGSFAALAVVKDRIHVTVEPEESAAQRGPDPLELLRADVGEMKGDVAALAGGVGEQMQQLHDALEGAATERARTLETQVAELRKQIVALQTRVEHAQAELTSVRAQSNEATARLETELRNVAASVAASPTPVARTEVAVPSEPAAEPTPVAAVVETPAVVAQSEPAPVEPTEAPPTTTNEPPPAKKGFLSFKVPSQTFSFAGRQRLALVPSLSRVGFDAKSTLHDFSGVTQKVEGELVVDLARAEAFCQGTVKAESKSLDTGLADRDVEMRKRLDVDKFPAITFEWLGFVPASVDAAAQTLEGNAKGKLTIHGVARDVVVPVKVAVDASKRVAIDGELSIKLTDFGIEPPSQLGMIKVEDGVKLWLALRARSLGPVQEATSGN